MQTSVFRDDALRWWDFARAGDWWQSQMPISTYAMAGALNMTQQAFWASLHETGTNTNQSLRRQIRQIIPDIEKRALVFPAAKTGGPKFLWLEPPAIPPRIPKYDDGSAWSLWAECQRCQGNKFLPVVMNGKPHVMCYHCLPPKQYTALGAKRVEKSLIHEALKKYY